MVLRRERARTEVSSFRARTWSSGSVREQREGVGESSRRVDRRKPVFSLGVKRRTAELAPGHVLAWVGESIYMQRMPLVIQGGGLGAKSPIAKEKALSLSREMMRDGASWGKGGK